MYTQNEIKRLAMKMKDLIFKNQSWTLTTRSHQNKQYFTKCTFT